jgi:uncharacterized protein (TIGR03067 family)
VHPDEQACSSVLYRENLQSGRRCASIDRRKFALLEDRAMKPDIEAPAAPSALPAALVGAFLHGLIWLGVFFLYVSFVGTIERTYRDFAMTVPAVTEYVFAASRFIIAFGPFSFAVLMLFVPIDFVMLWALDRPGGLRVLREFWTTLALGLPAAALAFTAFALTLPSVKVTEALMRTSASHDAAVRTEMTRLCGKWKQVGAENDGQAVAIDPGQPGVANLILQGDRFTWEAIGEAHGVFDLWLRRSPKQITFSYSNGPHMGHSRVGLYKLEGDKLTICLAPINAFGDDLPVDFATRGTRNEMTIWQRQP